VKVGDLVRVKRGFAWKYEPTREWARTLSPLLVLDAGNPAPSGTIKVCNKENLWVPKRYFEVISEAR